MDIELNACKKAAALIKKYLPQTPCQKSLPYSDLLGHDVYLKFENKMLTGSFKERGALNSLLMLSAAEKKNGVCCASAGNHALALSYHAARLGISCEIVMPVQAPLVKIKASQKNGAKVILHGDTLAQSMEHAKELSQASKRRFIPPYDDKHVICGQASCGFEILEQCPKAENIIVSVGGGGLISGIATVVKAKRPNIKIIGVQSEWAERARKAKGVAAGRLRPVSIADGIAVKHIGELTQPIMDKKVDKLLTVSEGEIADALIQFLEVEKMLIEGAAAAAIAALNKKIISSRSKCTVVVISGSNIDMNILSRLIEREMAEQQRLLRIHASLPDRPGTLARATQLIAAEGGNVLQVHHDRSFSKLPGDVEITFVIEVRDANHKRQLTRKLSQAGIKVRELVSI